MSTINWQKYDRIYQKQNTRKPQHEIRKKIFLIVKWPFSNEEKWCIMLREDKYFHHFHNIEKNQKNQKLGIIR